jgi:acyl-CoA-binding protein
MFNLFQKDPNVINFPVSMGGYYTYQEDDGTYHAWRLIDFNVDVLHRRNVEGSFDHKPSLKEVKEHQLETMHIPQAATTLLRQKDLKYLGTDPLNSEDLEGYDMYLQTALGYTEDEASELLDKLIAFSYEGVGTIRLRRNPDDAQSFVRA